MGVVNVTPDSFSDAGQYACADRAIEHARGLVREGADILDIGGESTRPGAEPVSARQQWQRIAPVLEALLECKVPLSVDTRDSGVMRNSLNLGVDMINDVQAFAGDGALAAVANSSAALCLMHMRGEPRTMQLGPAYANVVDEVHTYLQARVQKLRNAGVYGERIVVDPGIGFGKTLEDNLALLAGVARFAALAPVLVGVSRKSMVGELTGKAVEQRLAGSLGGALAAVARGASIVRTHDVAATRDALKVWGAVSNAGIGANGRLAGAAVNG
ncbi:MAG: dihydropteroate synthase [Quisquiliibacterium sp.]